MHYINKKAFTLVELIVVVTIVGILSVVGIVAYSSYLVGARDVNRIATMTQAVETFQKYATTKKLPIPDSAITLTMSGGTVGFQGKIGPNVLETIGLEDDMRDPKDNTLYSYLLGENRKVFQFVAFMEKKENLISFAPTALANNENRYPRTFGTGLGIITQSKTLIPLEDLPLGSDTLNLEDFGNSYELTSFVSQD
ncbi:prepilin-type N-terminal cleavage/methylation domain-containing protein [Candidatus Gracilibacteria bacterium]|nr:prepilin-type N-terminal cleavage/methylation domain-containing protein [Candidatus Gracilibacteria bacterium]